MFLKTDSIHVDDPSIFNYITYDEIARSSSPRKSERSDFYAYKLDTNQLLAHRQNFCKGSMVLVPEKYNGYITSNQVQLFNINQNIVLPEYLYYMLSRASFINSLEDMDLSTDNWNYTFSKHKIMVPNIDSQSNFLDFTKGIEKSLSHTIKCKAQAYETLQSMLCEHIKA